MCRLEYYISILDLTPAFEKAYRDHKKNYYFKVDQHWNEKGFAFAAEKLISYLMYDEKKILLKKNN